MTKDVDMANVSSVDRIAELRTQQSKTLELYKELYESFIQPKSTDVTPGTQGTRSSTTHPTQESFREFVEGADDAVASSETPEEPVVAACVTEESLNSTCGISRVTSQNTTVSEMWRDFSIDKYAPRQRKSQPKHHSAPPKRSRPRRPRITVPDPFFMTLRDELKKPSKTKNQVEAEMKQKEMELAEEAECRKQFKASPVPPSTFENRLKAIQQKQEARRERVKSERKALTKALQKPFSFEERAAIKRSRSLSALDGEEPKQQATSHRFSARPFPHHLFDGEAEERMREEEAYRGIRVKMRAEQMLAESDLPSSMKRHALHYTDGRIRRAALEEREQRAHLTEEHTFSPVIRNFIPDFEMLHKQEEEALTRRQVSKPTTVVEPFTLRTEVLAECKKRQLAVKSHQQPEERRAGEIPYCHYTGVYPELATESRPTLASTLRDSITKQRIHQEKEKEEREREREIVAKMRQLELKKEMAARLEGDPPTTTKSEELRKKLEQQKMRELEYKNQLAKMQARVSERPFLFEQQAPQGAGLDERTFRGVLERAGLSGEMIEELFEQDSLMA